MVDLPPERWRFVAIRAAKFIRNGRGDITILPDELFGMVPLLKDDEAWSRVRRKINSRRRGISRVRLTERRRRKQEARRLYMKDYMTRYRSKNRVDN